MKNTDISFIICDFWMIFSIKMNNFLYQIHAWCIFIKNNSQFIGMKNFFEILSILNFIVLKFD